MHGWSLILILTFLYSFYLEMNPNNNPLISTVDHPLVGIMTDIAYDLCEPKNIYQIVTVHSMPNGPSKTVTWIIRKKGAQRIFVEKHSFDALLKRDRPHRNWPALMRVTYDQVLRISHSNKPMLEDGQMAPGSKLLYENDAARHTLCI